ncbi:MAG: hypothetical protein AUG51_20295 [Acidobacteria bacterium 13_1_20CM_3_53_8]|nr:MAG: hypothetical protein AUG51_20295 [Acidobacteria bacterium 13_1_20CM_3_53_8]
MPDLIVKYPDRSPDTFPLGRLRITIGRSARNDLCIPDPFASRVHAEVRKEGDQYILQDLGSANGTLYNGLPVETAIPLTPGGRIQIGETEIVFDDDSGAMGATMITDHDSSPVPEVTIALSSSDRTTSGLLEQIEGARTQPDREAPQKRAERQGDLLALISKVGVTLLASATLNETLQQIVALVFESVPADRCLIMMREGKEEELKVRVARLRDRVGEVGEIRVSRTIMEEVVGQGKSVLTADAQHDERLMSHTMTLQGIRSVLAVPLGVGEKVFGIIYADSPIAEGRFTEDHLKVLTTLASVAAIRVENARLTEEQIERERLEHELQLASEIQQRFQPTAPPQVAGYELQGISFPCYEIGGDYYDFIERDDGRLIVALGDVSGKGTAAALLMSSLHAAGTVEHLASGGLPLGITVNAQYKEGRTQLQEGDVLVIYSDGVSEAYNPQGEEFGTARLSEAVARNLDASASGIRDRIESALTKFAEGTAAADDITLVIVKRQAEAASVAAIGV